MGGSLEAIASGMYSKVDWTYAKAYTGDYSAREEVMTIWRDESITFFISASLYLV